MQKKVLSEIDMYYGTIETPKGFEIKRDVLKNFILNSFIKNQTMSNNQLDYSYADYELSHSREYSFLLDYIRDLQNENNRLNLINNDLINKLKRIKHLKK